MLNIKRLIFLSVFLGFFFSTSRVIAQKINQYNDNNQRTGVWKKYYPNKTIRYEGEFKNGKEVGVFKFYRESFSGFPSIIKKYVSKTDSIYVEFYSTKGTLETKGIFIGKKRVGAWTYFFNDGKIMSKEVYKDGLLHGTLINYYPNGKETEISKYKNGLKEGVSKKFSSDGILIEEITFKNDKPNGLAKYYELNGNLKEMGVYKNGKRSGKWEFYMDGEIADKKELEKDKKYKKNKK